ncbi:hypothetical protein SMC26_11920 [Actinomadura fulvescens]
MRENEVRAAPLRAFLGLERDAQRWLGDLIERAAEAEDRLKNRDEASG